MLLFRNLVYSRTEEQYLNNIDKMNSDEVMAMYPNYLEYLTTVYFQRVEKWAMYKRLEEEMPIHNTNTNNYIESTFRNMKNIVFARCKAYNLFELCEILLNENSNYYTERCIAIGNNRFTEIHCQKSRYKTGEITLRKDQVIEIDKELGYYMVESQREEGTVYFVDQKSGYCQCEKGKLRGPCPHKHCVQFYYGVAEFSSIPEFDPSARAKFHWIGTGKVL